MKNAILMDREKVDGKKIAVAPTITTTDQWMAWLHQAKSFDNIKDGQTDTSLCRLNAIPYETEKGIKKINEILIWCSKAR